MGDISLRTMTRELCHELIRNWENDPDIYMDMAAVNADVIAKNKRSQHVLEKVGFQLIKEENGFKYYRCER